MLRSPVTGHALLQSGLALCAGGERWPVVDGIPFLHAKRRDLADAALQCLDCGAVEDALVLLLGDQDDWARTPPPDEASRRELVRHREELCFREAMALLAFGPVGTYFAHRWSDPTFLSGLALAQSHWQDDARVLEIACGAGHFLRAFAPNATCVTGGDVVFAKLWLARHYVAPQADLVCFDASSPWPFSDGFADQLFCHDAFYFLPHKKMVASEMMRAAPRVLVGHMHNALADNLSSGAPLSPEGYAALFPGCRLFDDRELTSALIDARAPRAASVAALHNSPALAVAWHAGDARPARGPLTRAEPGRLLRRNPLYQNGRIVWPSERYAAEYGPLATYPAHVEAPALATAGAGENIDAMAHARVLLDLPDHW